MGRRKKAGHVQRSWAAVSWFAWTGRLFGRPHSGTAEKYNPKVDEADWKSCDTDASWNVPTTRYIALEFETAIRANAFADKVWSKHGSLSVARGDERTIIIPGDQFAAIAHLLPVDGVELKPVHPRSSSDRRWPTPGEGVTPVVKQHEKMLERLREEVAKLRNRHT